MGKLIDGVWHNTVLISNEEDGSFNRPESVFRHWLVRPAQHQGDCQALEQHASEHQRRTFPAAPNRYHLYVGLACPWAHRTLIVRALKGLERLISVSVVHWEMLDQGWTFAPGQGVIADPVIGADYMHQIYTLSDPQASGKVTVPVLFDKQEQQIVSNESSEIIRMFNEAFDDLGAAPGHFYPEPLRDEIDAINERVYHTLNNGVYRCGFATAQAAYEEAVIPLFDTLDWLEQRLTGCDYLVANQCTEADIRLFTTLIRFDAVYYSHFKCNKKRIQDYPNLRAFVQRFMSQPKIAETVDFHHIKHHYYGSHRQINPTGIVPMGPDVLY